MDSHYLYVFTWNPFLNRVSASSLANSPVNSREALELIPCNAVDRYGSGDAVVKLSVSGVWDHTGFGRSFSG